MLKPRLSIGGKTARNSWLLAAGCCILEQPLVWLLSANSVEILSQRCAHDYSMACLGSQRLAASSDDAAEMLALQ